MQFYSGLKTSGLFKAVTIKKVLIIGAFFYVQLLLCGSLRAQPVDCPPPQIDESARVSYVYDGDTLQLEDGRKVRLIGIDTPEVFSRKRAIASDIKDSGERARAALIEQLKLANNHVSLTYGQQRFDRYGRTLAHVYLTNGKNLQAWLISRGHAIAFTTPPNDRMSRCYRKLEQRAMGQSLGIWQMTQYQLMSTYQLSGRVSGFHRLQGTVSRVIEKRNRLLIILDESVEIIIHKSDLPNFNAYQLNTIKGKKIRVRGWLKSRDSNTKMRNEKNKIQYFMVLRHGDSFALSEVIH